MEKTREELLEDALRKILYPKPGVSITWEETEEMKKLLHPVKKPPLIPRGLSAEDKALAAFDKARDAFLSTLAGLQDHILRKE